MQLQRSVRLSQTFKHEACRYALGSVSYTHLDVYKRQLNEYGEAQSIKISEDLADMTWRIKSVAKFAAASEFDPESEEFNQYLSTVNGDNDFPVSYIPAWKWEKRAEEADLKPEEREFLSLIHILRRS